MERLTTKVDNLYQTNDKFTPLLGIKRLGEYEDTGLTPEEIENLKDQSAADVEEVVHGKWNNQTRGQFCKNGIFRTCRFYQCGKCKYKSIVKTNFCPNCGAKMDGGKANE